MMLPKSINKVEPHIMNVIQQWKLKDEYDTISNYSKYVTLVQLMENQYNRIRASFVADAWVFDTNFKNHYH